MSPASKSKSKDKKALKESQKASSKPSGSASAGSGIPASGYNPLLGTFHTLETTTVASASPLHSNGRFRNIDETDEHVGSSLGAGIEYDSVSNTGSWSGESEEHKEKLPNHSVRQETIPGADSDKREKIRQKNEKKHQRQKERRAQELHERCSGYLMSRKLEALALQLVAMGFSQERATMALILNEGRVEESVAWLFEGGEETDKNSDQTIGGSNLKIDISEELARIADMEIRYKCSKQEVERAVVASEGDLEKAAEALRTLKQDPPSGLPNPEETGDPPTVSNVKLSASINQSSGRPQAKLGQFSIAQQRRDEKDFNYAKTAVTSGGSLDSGSKNVEALKRIPPKLDWAKPQQTLVPAEKRWSTAGSNPSVSYSLASSVQVSPPPAKTDTRYMNVGSEFKNHQPGSVREPVTMMQRAQSVNTKQIPVTSISSYPPGTAPSWYPNSSVEIMKSSGLLESFPSTRNHVPNNLNSNQMYHQFNHQQQQNFLPGSSTGESLGSSRTNGSLSRTSASPTLAAATSLGLFSGVGSTGSSGASSPIDWSTGGSRTQLDYTNIDWSFDRGLGAKSAMRSVQTNGNGVSMVELQDGSIASGETSSAGSREWTSPFEGKDLFSLPRQFVSSPSL